MVTRESDQPIVQRIALAPQEINDAPCENFAWIVLPHANPQGNPCNVVQILVYPNELTEDVGGTGSWTCDCGSTTTIYIPLNSDIED